MVTLSRGGQHWAQSSQVRPEALWNSYLCLWDWMERGLLRAGVSNSLSANDTDSTELTGAHSGKGPKGTS